MLYPAEPSICAAACCACKCATGTISAAAAMAHAVAAAENLPMYCVRIRAPSWAAEVLSTPYADLQDTRTDPLGIANQCTDSRHAGALAWGFEDPRYGSLGYS